MSSDDIMRPQSHFYQTATRSGFTSAHTVLMCYLDRVDGYLWDMVTGRLTDGVLSTLRHRSAKSMLTLVLQVHLYAGDKYVCDIHIIHSREWR